MKSLRGVWIGAILVLGLATHGSTAASHEAGGARAMVMTREFRLTFRAMFPSDKTDSIVGFALIGSDAAHTVHRILMDSRRGLYYGYDIKVVRAAGSDTFNVAVGPLSPVAERHFLEGRWRDLCRGCDAPRAVNAAPQRYPSAQDVQAGDTITLDLLQDETSGQVMSDAITIAVSRAAGPPTPAPAPWVAPAEDLKGEKVWLQFTSASLHLNGSPLFEDQQGGSVQSDVIFVEVPGQGRLFLSLGPQPGCGLTRIGVVAGNKMTVTVAGNRYEWVSTGPIATPGMVPPFNSMQSWHVWGRHESDFEPFEGRYSIGAAPCTIERGRVRAANP